MFTSKNLKVLVFVTNLAWYTGAVPYRFEKDLDGDLRIVGSFTKGRVYKAAVNISLSSLYVIFIAFRVIQKVAFSEEDASVGFLVKMGYLFFVYGLASILQMNTVFYWDRVPRFQAQYIKFFRWIQSEYMFKSDKGLKCLKFFYGVMTISVGTLIQNTIHIRKAPHQEHFLTSLLENPLTAPKPLRLFVTLVNVWVWILIWVYIFVYCFHWYMYMTCGVFVVKELDVRIKKPRTKNSLREPKTFTKILRTMQVLHRLWQVNNEAWLCPLHKGTAMAIATLGTYGLIRLTGPRSIVMGVAAFFALMYMSTLFTKMGKLKEMSRSTLDNWLSSTETSKYIKKFVNSVPELRVNISSFYAVGKFTIVSVMWAVLNNTITLLFV